MREARVLIIGAGAAGLAAADVLQRHGLETAILEARKRIGGRVWTLHDPTLGVPVELGAEFIDQPAVFALAARRGLDFVPLRGEVRDIRQNKVDRAIASPSRYRLAGGCGGLIAGLVQGVPIETGTVARAVRWSSQEVRVETSRGECRAERSIVTVPLPILRDPARLRFDPELPSVRAAMLLEMEKAIRISIQFSEDFWSERMPKLRLLEGDDPSLEAWWTTYPVRSTLLTGWATGRRAANLSALPAEVLLTRALESLGRCFREPVRELARLVERHWSHDWQSDPYACGAYCIAGGAAAELARPASRTIFIAGEATATGSLTGTVAGALESGRLAARQLLESLSR
jgi:monoamine oxidase